MSIKKKIIRSFLTLSLITTLSISANGTISYADGNNSIENEFKSVIEKYDENEVEVENGVALRMGETLDLSSNPNWQLSNSYVAKINSDGILETLKPGTVFLSQKIGDKVHILEVYVMSNMRAYSFLAMPQEKRNYYKVFIDPGHGGSDPGNTTNGYEEADINLAVSKKVESKLKAKGIDVKMSRYTDKFINLGDRGPMANSYGADVFVSIHQNSAGATTTANGIETFYHPNKESHKSLSSDLQSNLIKETGAKSRGVKSENFAVLRTSDMPSSLVECGFMTNPTELQNLTSPTYQDKLATAISNGIEKYLKDNIDLGTNSEVPTGPVINTGVVVNTDSLNVRSGYGTSYQVIGTLKRGSKVEIFETKNGWHKIKYNGRTGYVSGAYIDIDKAVVPPTTPPTIEPEINFTDIGKHWAKEVILDFVDKGYIKGYSDKTFRPNDEITRAEFVKIVNQVFGLTKVDGNQKLQFTDVKSDAWYYNDLCIAVNAGYINGYSDNTFRPNGKITRQEAASIVASVTKLSGDGVLEFADKDKIADWAKSSVDALSDSNIMDGYEDKTFRPTNSITRAEAVSTLSRVNK